MGSANESRTAWTLNYELLWSDDSAEGIAWVREEFDALWTDPCAVELADAVVQDIGRMARRTYIPERAPGGTAGAPNRRKWRWNCRSTGARTDCGHTRSISCSGPSRRTGTAAPGWCWPIRWASARRCNSPWRPS